jgi:2-polyprenyl-3-methyl-5-hydroxy-6-metoxy-1,4-benzoquinol methylase
MRLKDNSVVDVLSSVTPTLCRLLGIAPPKVCQAPALESVLALAENGDSPPEARVRHSPVQSPFSATRVLVYAPDAIGRLFLERHPEPRKRLVAASDVAVNLRSVFPPKTPVCFASMFTGAPPEVHGIRKYERPVLTCDTLFDALARREMTEIVGTVPDCGAASAEDCPRSTISGRVPSGREHRVAIVAVKGSSMDIIFRNRPIDYFTEDYDPQVTERTLELVREDKHDFIVAYHQEYDDLMHRFGPESPEAVAAAKRHVETFVRLWQATEQHWQAHNRVLVFTPDHGAHNKAADGGEPPLFPQGVTGARATTSGSRVHRLRGGAPEVRGLGEKHLGDHGEDIPEDMEVTHFWCVRPAAPENPTERARKAWDDAADVWEDFVETGKDWYRLGVHGPALLRACGDVKGLRVLDLGCGQGYFSRLLAEVGAEVTGVDLSEKQIEYALKHEREQPLGIEYLVLDATSIAERWPAQSFDLVTACMAIDDVPEPLEALKAARRVLKGDGRCIFSTVHPVMDAPVRGWELDGDGRKVMYKLGRYFDSGPSICPWTMARLERCWTSPFLRLTFEGWSELIEQAGFLIRRVYEPRPTEAEAAAMPEVEDCRDFPSFLIFDLVKQKPAE